MYIIYREEEVICGLYISPSWQDLCLLIHLPFFRNIRGTFMDVKISVFGGGGDGSSGVFDVGEAGAASGAAIGTAGAAEGAAGAAEGAAGAAEGDPRVVEGAPRKGGDVAGAPDGVADGGICVDGMGPRRSAEGVISARLA